MKTCSDCKNYRTDGHIGLCLTFGQSVDGKSEGCIDLEEKEVKNGT